MSAAVGRRFEIDGVTVTVREVTDRFVFAESDGDDDTAGYAFRKAEWEANASEIPPPAVEPATTVTVPTFLHVFTTGAVVSHSGNGLARAWESVDRYEHVIAVIRIDPDGTWCQVDREGNHVHAAPVQAEPELVTS